MDIARWSLFFPPKIDPLSTESPWLFECTSHYSLEQQLITLLGWFHALSHMHRHHTCCTACLIAQDPVPRTSLSGGTLCVSLLAMASQGFPLYRQVQPLGGTMTLVQARVPTRNKFVLLVVVLFIGSLGDSSGKRADVQLDKCSK